MCGKLCVGVKWKVGCEWCEDWGSGLCFVRRNVGVSGSVTLSQGWGAERKSR
jgi:hypothetical protein